MLSCAEAGQYWDLVPAIVGGILGALAGGIPTWLLAKRQSDETLRRDREQRLENEKALAFSAGVKLLSIINSVVEFRNHIRMGMAFRQQPGCEHMEPWQTLIPLVGHTDEHEVRFTSTELAVFAAAKEYDFMQDMMLLAARNASSLESFRQYCIMRREFLAIGPKPTSFEGAIGSALLTAEQVEQYKPYTIPLNNIVRGLEEGVRKDYELATKVAGDFEKVTSTYFKVDKFLSFSIPGEAELEKSQQPPDYLNA